MYKKYYNGKNTLLEKARQGQTGVVYECLYFCDFLDKLKILSKRFSAVR